MPRSDARRGAPEAEATGRPWSPKIFLQASHQRRASDLNLVATAIMLFSGQTTQPYHQRSLFCACNGLFSRRPDVAICQAAALGIGLRSFHRGITSNLHTVKRKSKIGRRAGQELVSARAMVGI